MDPDARRAGIQVFCRPELVSGPGFRVKPGMTKYTPMLHKLRYILQSLEKTGICKYTDYPTMCEDLSV